MSSIVVQSGDLASYCARCKTLFLVASGRGSTGYLHSCALKIGPCAKVSLGEGRVVSGQIIQEHGDPEESDIFTVSHCIDTRGEKR